MSGKLWQDFACTTRVKYRSVALYDKNTRCVNDTLQKTVGKYDEQHNTHSTSSLYVLCIRMSPLRFSIYRAAQAHAMMPLPWKHLEIYMPKEGAAQHKPRFRQRSTAALTMNPGNQPDGVTSSENERLTRLCNQVEIPQEGTYGRKTGGRGIRVFNALMT